MTKPIGISRDFLGRDGANLWGDIGLGRLDDLATPWEYLPEVTTELTPEQIDGRPAVIFAAPAVTEDTFTGVAESPLVLARFGVGFDAVDLAACTAHDVAVTITPDGARRPVATAALTLILGTLQNVSLKDRLVREGRWAENSLWMGLGLTGMTVGLVGFGSTATDLVNLLGPFQTKILAYDPYCPPERAEELGAKLAPLQEVAASADVLVVMAGLTPETFHLVNADLLATMKPTAVIVNVARGPIVDEEALIEALSSGVIRGAGLDVFEVEPLPASSPLISMDNVLLSPHSIAWTDEMSRGNGASAIQAALDVLTGRVPRFVVNKDVLERESFQLKLRARAAALA